LLKLKERLHQLAEADLQQVKSDRSTAGLQDQLVRARQELKLAERNLAFAQNEDQFRAVATVIEERKQREASLSEKIAVIRQVPMVTDIDAEVEAAIGLATHLSEIASDPDRLSLAAQAVELANLRMFVSFHPVQAGKRVLNKVAGGVVTIGAAPPPIALYHGPTSSEEHQENEPCGRQCSHRAGWAFAHQIRTTRIRFGGNVVRKCKSGRLVLHLCGRNPRVGFGPWAAPEFLRILGRSVCAIRSAGLVLQARAARQAAQMNAA
jgi:hypothetical protein